MNEFLWKLDDWVNNIFIFPCILICNQAVYTFEMLGSKDIVILFKSIFDDLDNLQNQSFWSMFTDLSINLLLDCSRIVYTAHAVNV